MIDALVIGAGPAGSTAALRLARQGRDVLLVDRCRFPRRKPCGEYYNPGAVRLLRELGVLDEILAAGARPVRSLTLGCPAGRRLSVPFSEIAPGEELALSLGREELDWILVQAAKNAGARFIEGALVREPLLKGGAVAGAVCEIEGRVREIRARVTLAADGLRSRFARRLGLGAGDGGRTKLGLTARCPVRPGAAEALEMQAAGTGCCGLAIRDGVANLGMVVDGSRAREIGGDPAAFFRQELQRYPGLAAAVEGVPAGVLTVGPLTWRTRRQSAAGCLLLGDAAGFYDPFTGQGVTFALLTAELAADVAGRALDAGDLSAGRLAEYSRRRAAMLEPRVCIQKAIQAVIERPRLFQHVLRNLERRRETARTLLGIVADVTPPRRALSPAFLTGLVL